MVSLNASVVNVLKLENVILSIFLFSQTQKYSSSPKLQQQNEKNMFVCTHFFYILNYLLVLLKFSCLYG